MLQKQTERGRERERVIDAAETDRGGEIERMIDACRNRQREGERESDRCVQKQTERGGERGWGGEGGRACAFGNC